jgi:Arc/MetJ family transcription regulator
MATNVTLDDKLIDEAQRVGQHKTKRAAVTDALKEYIQRRKQKNILGLFGTVEWNPGYDHKKSRTR